MRQLVEVDQSFMDMLASEGMYGVLDFADDEHKVSHGPDGDTWWHVRYLLIFDKSDGEAFKVRLWESEPKPPPGTKITAAGPRPVPLKMTADDHVNQLDVLDSDGNTTATLGGMDVPLDDLLAGMAKDKPSDERYAFVVSLFDGDLTVHAGKADNRIEVGTGGTATVNAGNGDDLVRVWHQKNVVLNGGKGDDTISFSHSIGSGADAPTGAVVDLTAGTGTNPFGGTLTFVKVENVSGVDDQANILTGNGKANQLVGGHEADTINGMGGDDSITIQEIFTAGASRALSVDGGTGNDTLNANPSFVLDFTGTGFNVRHGNVLDLLNPSANTGTFAGGTFAGLETYRLTTSDTFAAQFYGFDFRGSDNGETAIGISGADNLQGRGGNDTLRGSTGADTIDGGDGRDVADYSDNNFAKIVAKINGASTSITVNGVQEDTLISIEGAKGGNANDKLTGDAGANEFDGSLGKDKLIGKGGPDHFVFSTALGGNNVDTIKDFKHGTDVIDLDDAIFGKLGPTVTSGEFLKVASGHAAQQGDDRLIYNTTDGTLWLDGDGSGNGAAIKFAVLTGSPDNLTFRDFHIV